MEFPQKSKHGICNGTLFEDGFWRYCFGTRAKNLPWNPHLEGGIYLRLGTFHGPPGKWKHRKQSIHPTSLHLSTAEQRPKSEAVFVKLAPTAVVLGLHGGTWPGNGVLKQVCKQILMETPPKSPIPTQFRPILTLNSAFVAEAS